MTNVEHTTYKTKFLDHFVTNYGIKLLYSFNLIKNEARDSAGYVEKKRIYEILTHQSRSTTRRQLKVLSVNGYIKDVGEKYLVTSNKKLNEAFDGNVTRLTHWDTIKDIKEKIVKSVIRFIAGKNTTYRGVDKHPVSLSLIERYLTSWSKSSLSIICRGMKRKMISEHFCFIPFSELKIFNSINGYKFVYTKKGNRLEVRFAHGYEYSI